MEEVSDRQRSRKRKRIVRPDQSPKPSKKSQRTSTAVRKAQMLAALADTKTNISAACERVGINRWTHYNWMDNDEEYAQEVEAVAEKLIDSVETMFLRSTIESDDRRSMRWFLERKARHRGYGRIEKRELTGEDGGPIEVDNSPTMKELVKAVPPDDLVGVLETVRNNASRVDSRKNRAGATNGSNQGN